MSRLNQLRIIALAMMAAGFLYVVVLFTIEFGDGSDPQSLWVPMYAAALVAAAASFVVPRLMSSAQAVGLDMAVQRFFTQRIIALAMSEAVIVFGFVGAFLAQEPLGIVPFFALGELLMLLHFPRAAALASAMP